MRILFFGDVVGKSGRDFLFSNINNIVSSYFIDFCVVNVENSAHGFGVIPSIAQKFLSCNIDVLTTGDHIWDKFEIKDYIKEENRILRPANYNKFSIGSGFNIFVSKNNKRVLVVNLLGTLFMKKEGITNPFCKIDEILSKYKLGIDVDVIFVDFHAETTSEKMAFANYVDGRVSAVIGTHTHIPTADAHILPSGTGYQTDAGMCGCYDSSIGMNKYVSIDRFIKPDLQNRLEPAVGMATLCGSIIDIADNGLATSIKSFIFGDTLHCTHDFS